MKKVKRLLALTLVLMMVVALFAMPASAYSKSATLTKTDQNVYINIGGNYTTAAGNLTTYSDSNDGVYFRIDYREDGGYWREATKMLAEPGQSASVSNVKRDSAVAWRGVLTSWWPAGTGCHAYGVLTLS